MWQESKATWTENLRDHLTREDLMDPKDKEAFLLLAEQYNSKKTDLVWTDVLPPSEEFVIPFDSIPESPTDQSVTHELLNKLAVLKLNGGLGTSMGCDGPKSTLEVRQGMTFLDMTVRQVEYLNFKYGVDVPLVLMNSFNTQKETDRVIQKYRAHNITIHTFSQSCFPVIARDTMLPLATTPYAGGPEGSHWYPPGHGDLYYSLFRSGVLESLLDQGKEYIFVSNVDNLGATVNLDLLYHIMISNLEFTMEVTDKTRADITGGTLVSYQGGPRLVEASEVPKDMDVAQWRKSFTLFHTNNLWINLRAIQRLMSTQRIRCPVLGNSYVVDGIPVVRLETIAGSAVQFFERSVAIHVPRGRFLPVKTTSDLLSVQSNLYTTKHGRLFMNPARPYPTIPIIKLGPEFQRIRDYDSRFKGEKPDMVELEHLTVSGDVTFGSSISLKGTVIIVANEGHRIDLASGTCLEDKVVTGYLRILEH